MHDLACRLRAGAGAKELFKYRTANSPMHYAYLLNFLLEDRARSGVVSNFLSQGSFVGM